MTELAYPSGLKGGSEHMGLWKFRECLRPAQVLGFRDIAVAGLALHSSEVRPGDLFFAIRGTRRNGAEFVDEAIARGAVAVVSQVALNVGCVDCPVLVVNDARQALADAAREFYGNPSASLQVLGITGTNGKTSVAHMLRGCLIESRKSVGVLGTLGYEYGGRQIPASNTTPDSLHIQGYLSEMVDRGCQACVLEVSSHALAQDRVRGVEFDVGVFLNLTQDHLDYHGTMPEYARAKARLFSSLGPQSRACINVDSEAAGIMMEALDPSVELITFGMRHDADVRAENLSCSIEGTRFELVMPRGRVDVYLRLPGEHNVMNALAAAAASLAAGVTELTVGDALNAEEKVPGRLERCEYRCGVRVFVDYAHTPDALHRVCGAMRALSPGRLLVVFGCGGDRDADKRPKMSEAVAQHADIGYLTSDNPRSEDPEAILDQMESGLTGKQFRYERVADRAEAIQRAIFEAKRGDTVLIAGKGHETCQILMDSVVPFDDGQVAEEALDAKAARG